MPPKFLPTQNEEKHYSSVLCLSISSLLSGSDFRCMLVFPFPDPFCIIQKLLPRDYLSVHNAQSGAGT